MFFSSTFQQFLVECWPRGCDPLEAFSHPSPSRAQATSWESGQSRVLFFLQTITRHMALHVYKLCWVFHTNHIRTEATSCEPIFSGRERTIWKHKNQASFSFNEKDAWFFFIKENILSQSISDKEDKHLEIQNWQTDIYFWKGKMPILNTLYLRLTYKTNRSWSCYIFWSDQSPANQWSVSYSLSEPVIDKVTNWAVLER